MTTEKVIMATTQLADWLWHEIEERHMSVRAFGRAADVSHETINKLLAPVDWPDWTPSIPVLVNIARYTHTDICSLVAMITPEDTQINPRATLLAEKIINLPPDQRALAETYIIGAAFKPRKE